MLLQVNTQVHSVATLNMAILDSCPNETLTAPIHRILIGIVHGCCSAELGCWNKDYMYSIFGLHQQKKRYHCSPG